MKAIKVIIKCIIGIILVLLLGCLVLAGWDAAVLLRMDQISEMVFDLPGYEDARFDLQAVSFDEETNTFFFSGYMKDKSICPLYLRTGDGMLQRMELVKSDGSVLHVHAGGIAVCGDYIYLAGSEEDCLYVFSKEEVLAAEDGDSVKSLGTFATARSKEDGVKVSFLTSDEDKLYMGEFHLPLLPWFRLRSSHHIGSTYAWMAAFAINPDKPMGLEETPCEVYCLPEMVQGCVVQDEKLYLSRSFFLIPSEIASYEKKETGSVMLMGEEVPLFSLVKTSGVRMAPFSEEIELADGKLYIATEVCSLLPSWIYQIWDGQKGRAVPVAYLNNSRCHIDAGRILF